MLPVKVKQAKTRAKGTPGQGRPKGAKDSGQRKTRTPKPRTSATLFALQAAGRRHQATIAELLTPLYLDAVAKRNLRGLTTAQAADLERLKFDLLCTVDPDLGPVPAAVTAALASPPAPIPRARRALDRLVAEVHGETPPVADELREIHVCVYALLNTTGDDDGEADD